MYAELHIPNRRTLSRAVSNFSTTYPTDGCECSLTCFFVFTFVFSLVLDRFAIR
jgi:hypothetical protein